MCSATALCYKCPGEDIWTSFLRVMGGGAAWRSDAQDIAWKTARCGTWAHLPVLWTGIALSVWGIEKCSSSVCVCVYPHRLQFSLLYTGMSSVTIKKGLGLQPRSVCPLLVQAVSYVCAQWARISTNLLSWETINHFTFFFNSLIHTDVFKIRIQVFRSLVGDTHHQLLRSALNVLLVNRCHLNHFILNSYIFVCKVIIVIIYPVISFSIYNLLWSCNAEKMLGFSVVIYLNFCITEIFSGFFNWYGTSEVMLWCSFITLSCNSTIIIFILVIFLLPDFEQTSLASIQTDS